MQTEVNIGKDTRIGIKTGDRIFLLREEKCGYICPGRNQYMKEDFAKIRWIETLLRASADGIVITDPANNIIFVNDIFCKFFSSNRQDMIGTNFFVWLAKLDPNAKDIWKGLENQINEHGIAKDVEFEMQTGERMRYYSVNSSLLEKIDIEETGLIISIWRDDTQRKMAQEALKRAHDELEMRVKERTEQLSNTNIELRTEINERKRAENILRIQKDIASSISVSGDIEIILDRVLKAVSHIEGMDSGGIYISDRLTGDLILRAHYGFSTEYVRAVARYPPDTPQWQLVKAGQPVYWKYSDALPEMKLESRKPEGLRGVAIIPIVKEGHVFASLNLASHTQNEIPVQTRMILETIAAQLRDVIACIEAEEKLRRSEECFRKLIETEPECVKLLTEENVLVDMNPAGLRMIEADSREQVIGRSVLGIIDPVYRTAFVDLVKRVFKGESVILEFSITGLKGTKRWLETHSVPLRDDKGTINLLISITHDITQRKRDEQKRIALVEREQAAIAEAEAARKLDRMKSMFIAATSHELRTPLNSIIGFTSLILDGNSGELNPDQKEQLMIVHSSGKHLLSLINDILDLSMIESGNVISVVSKFNLRQIVDEAVTNLNVLLNEKNLRLKVDVGDIIMKSDRLRILQCLINLISNAVKYTEKGSIEITARVIDNNVELSVTDTGIGIKTEDIPKLFGPFVRLQSHLTLRTSGTGLGLYLVKKLAIDFLGGDMEVESEFGKGSKFTLRVPVELEGKA